MNTEDLPSICIPRVVKRTTKHNVEKIFKQLGWGQIKNITIKYKGDYNQVFVDFSKWSELSVGSCRTLNFHQVGKKFGQKCL